MLYNREGAIDVCEQYKETHKDVYFNFADYRSANVGKLPKEEYIANIISIRHIYSFNGTNIIALALATKRLK